MPKCYVLIGPPGSGKTTLRNEILKDNPETVVISSDDYIEMYAETMRSIGIEMNYSQAFEEIDKKAVEKAVLGDFERTVRTGADVLIDRTNMTRKSRAKFLNLIPDASHLPGGNGYQKIAMVMQTHPVVLEDRLIRRAKRTGKHIPWHVVRNMQASYEHPQAPEFYTVFIHGENSPTVPMLLRHRFRQIRRAFRKLFA